ncbi:MAG: hypothetical protein JW384_02795 [Nitrosomonadaceae bacterium]|nr:hypothetical protein [Nitrosomonadaceae bacterium]
MTQEGLLVDGTYLYIDCDRCHKPIVVIMTDPNAASVTCEYCRKEIALYDASSLARFRNYQSRKN